MSPDVGGSSPAVRETSDWAEQKARTVLYGFPLYFGSPEPVAAVAEALREAEATGYTRGHVAGERVDSGTEWFWRIVDAHGLADVPSDEAEALRLILARLDRATKASA